MKEWTPLWISSAKNDGNLLQNFDKREQAAISNWWHKQTRSHSRCNHRGNNSRKDHKTLRTIKNIKAPGPENVYFELLKNIIWIIKEAIRQMCQ